MTLQWTKMRGGLWHGVKCGRVVAIVERSDEPSHRHRPYRLTIWHLGLAASCRTADEARRVADRELSQ